MKKIIILAGVLLCGGLTLAQTTPQNTTAPAPTTAPTTSQKTTTTAPATAPAPKTQTAVVPDNQDTMDAVTKNIDRRLAYFNRYKQTGDMEALSKLVSEKNKDFYTSFTTYVKLSPAFTLKRNTTAKIVKTPSGDYFVPSILTVDGKEKKVSVTFVEEKSAQGSKWLISNSTFHTQAGTTNTGTNLGSSSIDPKTGTKPPTTPKTTPANVGSQAVATLPDKKAPDSPQKNTPVIQETGFIQGLGIVGIVLIVTFIIISVGGFVFWIMMLIDCIHRDFDKKTLWIILLVFLGLPATIAYYFIVKKKGESMKEVAAAASAVAATAFVAAEATPPPAPITATPPAPAVSNVTVSTVEEVHNAASEAEIQSTEYKVQNEKASVEKPSPVISENDAHTSISPEISQEAENMIAPPPPVEPMPAPEETPAPLNEAPPITVQEKETPSVPIENTIPETPVIEKPISDIFLTPSPAPSEPMVVQPTEKPLTESHPLFEGVFDSAKPKTEV